MPGPRRRCLVTYRSLRVPLKTARGVLRPRYVRAFARARTQYPWVGGMFVWNLNFSALPDIPRNDEKPPFSIISPDFSPRPAYNALRAMPK